MNQFEKFNTAETFNFIRSHNSYRNDHGELCRSVQIQPADANDPNEGRAHLVVSGHHRIGFDPRTHKAWVRDGEVIIAPLAEEVQLREAA